MNELIKTTVNENGEILVSGRELHEFLESKERFSKWFEKMVGYGLKEEVDYTPYQMVHPQNKQPVTDFVLKVDAAKEIAMLQRNEKGKEARQYFIEIEKKYTVQQSPGDPITLALEAALETRKQVQAVRSDVAYLKETMRIDGVEQFQLNNAGKKKVLDALGGKNAPAYKVLSRTVFGELWRDFKKYFTVPRYSELPKIKYAEGMQYIGLWEPNASVKMEIRKINAQSQLAFPGDE